MAPRTTIIMVLPAESIRKASIRSARVSTSAGVTMVRKDGTDTAR